MVSNTICRTAGSARLRICSLGSVLVLTSCAIGIRRSPAVPHGPICWAERTEDGHVWWPAEQIIEEVYRQQGADSTAVAERVAYGTPVIGRGDATVITEDSGCARVAAAIEEHWKREGVSSARIRRVAAARLGRGYAVQVDEAGLATVYLLDEHLRVVGGWSGP